MFFFFFKQKTAYEMRISDWSSDVCSSDLLFDRDKTSSARTDVEYSDMATFLAPAAYAASKSLAAQGLSAKRSHLSELLAALLGYRTLAALTAADLDPGLNYHFDYADVTVLLPPTQLERYATLTQKASVPVVP